jgi:hypothetical protein
MFILVLHSSLGYCDFFMSTSFIKHVIIQTLISSIYIVFFLLLLHVLSIPGIIIIEHHRRCENVQQLHIGWK